MALPVEPNQITINEIATEFGGSAPHALSEYYGDGNAPGSGEIQVAADFWGTSATITTDFLVLAGGGGGGANRDGGGGCGGYRGCYVTERS